mgnify:CR=1 FL=1
MDLKNDRFTFEISLSVLNHLGRNLYRSFMTVLGEAISNAWDADAENVWIYIDRENRTLVIKDDGVGMDEDDFQNKFLKIGYSKRKENIHLTDKGRPFIGRKGIGKLALLSCAKKITILTRKEGSAYIGGVIDNSDLDDAITNDLTPNEYELGELELSLLEKYLLDSQSGTIIYFENLNEGISNRVEYLRKMIALYFRFALIDDNFKIFVEDELITLDHLQEFADQTQFLWVIGDISDPYLSKLEEIKEKKSIPTELNISGFIASVIKPSNLKIRSTDEKVSVDLFVNGRLREKDILKQIPTTRIVESYLYGQIHFNDFDTDEKDRFTSSREGIVADDELYRDLLENLRIILSIILDDWDKWRRKHKQDGDSANPSITPKERKSEELFNVVSSEYVPDTQTDITEQDKKVQQWVDELGTDARFNFGAYADCFISENLIRKYIEDQQIPLSPEAQEESDKWKRLIPGHKINGNLTIDIRQNPNDLSYLDMNYLAYLVDNKKDQKGPCLARDADTYKPMRDALMHTALLSQAAKITLSSVYENIKGRIKILLKQ